MKKLVLAAAVAAATMGSVTTAQAVELSGNVSYVTDYRFRGESQNFDNVVNEASAALQGGFDADFGNGFYAGTWASNVNFENENTIEFDFYGGFASEIGDTGVSYDVGLLHYYYDGFRPNPGDADIDTTELYGSVGYMGFTLGAAYTLTDEYFGVRNQDGTVYYTLSYDYAVNDSLSLSASISQLDAGEATTLDEYNDYSIGASYAYEGFDFGLTYIGTGGKAETNNFNDGTVVFSVGKSL